MPIVKDPYTGRLMHVRPGDPRGHWTKLPATPAAVDISAFLSTTRIIQSYTSIQSNAGAPPTSQVTTVNSTGAPTENGTASALNDATGFYRNYLTTTAVGNAGGWVAGPGGVNAGIVVTMDTLPDITWIIKTGAGAADIANCRIWAALVNAAGVNNTSTLSSASGGIGFRFAPSTAGSDTNWMASSSNGATNENTSTGVAVTQPTRYILRVKVVSLTSVEYYVDGTLTNTLVTTLPAATLALTPTVYVVNNTVGTARNLRIRQAMCLST